MGNQLEIGANILKRSIEHVSAGPFDGAQEEALEYLNQALEECFAEETTPEWTGSPCPNESDNLWIDDETGKLVNAYTGERGLISSVDLLEKHGNEEAARLVLMQAADHLYRQVDDTDGVLAAVDLLDSIRDGCFPSFI